MSEFKAMKSRLSLGNAAENPVNAPHRKDYEIIGGRVPVSVINWPRELQNVGQTQSKDPSWAYRGDSISLRLPTWWAGTISRENWLHGERVLGGDVPVDVGSRYEGPRRKRACSLSLALSAHCEVRAAAGS